MMSRPCRPHGALSAAPRARCRAGAQHNHKETKEIIREVLFLKNMRRTFTCVGVSNRGRPGASAGAETVFFLRCVLRSRLSERSLTPVSLRMSESGIPRRDMERANSLTSSDMWRRTIGGRELQARKRKKNEEQCGVRTRQRHDNSEGKGRVPGAAGGKGTTV